MAAAAAAAAAAASQTETEFNCVPPAAIEHTLRAHGQRNYHNGGATSNKLLALSGGPRVVGAHEGVRASKTGRFVELARRRTFPSGNPLNLALAHTTCCTNARVLF